MHDWDFGPHYMVAGDLPGPEVERLVVHIVGAIYRATDGRLSEGYDLLVCGLRRAEGQAARGEPWGMEAVIRYRRAIGNYCRRYMVSMEAGRSGCSS